ncbi:TPA: hypothetical protein U7N21_001287 [Streptococcus agalactiae]|nr:hypothetical protein [Streptococcus agalactiae]
MTVEQAERIAQSQFVWAILFILLFMIVVGYLVRTSDKREKKLMDFHEQSKTDSNKREEKLMNHLEKTTTELGIISTHMGNMQNEIVKINNRIDFLERGNKK